MNTPKVSKSGRSKHAKAARVLTPDELFFYEHAGYSYDPKTETPEQGRIACARAMAQAEQYGRNLDWSVSWEDDWMIGSHVKEYGEDVYSTEPSTCETAILRDSAGNVLASLSCIDDADANYRRVIAAELASEALADYDRQIETLDGGV